MKSSKQLPKNLENQIERYIFRFLDEIIQLDEKLEKLRKNLFYNTRDFNESQFFRKVALDHLERPVDYIDEMALKLYFNSVMHEGEILPREICYLLKYFSEKNNHKIYLENLQDILLPHTTNLNRQKLNNERINQIEGSGDSLSKEIERKIVIMLKAEIKFYRKIEKHKMEIFQLFSWNLFNINMFKQKLFSIQNLLHFLKQFDHKYGKNDALCIWRRIFYLNQRKYQTEVMTQAYLRPFFVPQDYFFHTQISENNFFGQNDDYQYQSHYMNSDNIRKQGLYADYTVPALNEAWKEIGNLPISVQFYNNSNDIQTIQQDKFMKDMINSLKKDKKRDQKQKYLDQALEYQNDLNKLTQIQERIEYKKYKFEIKKDLYRDHEDILIEKLKPKYYYNNLSDYNRKLLEQEKQHQHEKKIEQQTFKLMSPQKQVEESDQYKKYNLEKYQFIKKMEEPLKNPKHSQQYLKNEVKDKKPYKNPENNKYSNFTNYKGKNQYRTVNPNPYNHEFRKININNFII
ncbi:hypothetical protein PPERSA_08406 [Pseudocohnilembus persalinus]|uniref:Uncharacterized protein n=1 Tax=Pseudocohnilembus persalinus TaxID=266149 RepID=A0A0V0R698_PSEPJ|nr:hypothetical protein PPERSA_08406 [Pseudocohnilembus persalinus]|eukprot:KRX10003.1 hypothetical protein PPERSA_08406 [Pseudocohnilembus persalinus]